jgi:two-component sensor histidine kinase
MPLTQFKSVRQRLLAGMAIIIVPVASLSVMLASTTYGSLVDRIEASETETTSQFAARSLAWFNGAARSLLSAAASIDSAAGRSADCSATLGRVVAANLGYVAMRVRFDSGRLCEADAGAIGAEDLAAVAKIQELRAHDQQWTGGGEARGRFDAVRIGATRYLLVDVRDANAPNGALSALVLANPNMLDTALRLDPADQEAAFAVMKRGEGPIVSSGAPKEDLSWLPARERSGKTVTLWRALSRAGHATLYGAQTISEPNLYVLARFDGRARQAAWQQFAILCVTPLLMILLLILVYAQIVEKDVLRWIQAINASARSQMDQPDRALPAPVDPTMPIELRTVSESFNAMVAEADQREEALRRLLQINRELMREMHHRVKNSLQIIQSYLALSRREQTENNNRCLAETEARVQVLASAYRLGLAEGGMGLVPARPFVEEIVANVSFFARAPHQWVSISIEWGGAMIIDRIIPLGLALVETLIAALNAPGSADIKVTLKRLDEDYLELRVAGDGGPLDRPSEKVMTGLAGQLNAKMEYREDGKVFVLTFPP